MYPTDPRRAATALRAFCTASGDVRSCPCTRSQRPKVPMLQTARYSQPRRAATALRAFRTASGDERSCPCTSVTLLGYGGALIHSLRRTMHLRHQRFIERCGLAPGTARLLRYAQPTATLYARAFGGWSATSVGAHRLHDASKMRQYGGLRASHPPTPARATMAHSLPPLPTLSPLPPLAAYRKQGAHQQGRGISSPFLLPFSAPQLVRAFVLLRWLPEVGRFVGGGGNARHLREGGKRGAKGGLFGGYLGGINGGKQRNSVMRSGDTPPIPCRFVNGHIINLMFCETPAVQVFLPKT